MTYVIQKAAHLGLTFPDDSLKLYVSLNPDYYNTYKTLSHYYLSAGRRDEASSCLQKALTLDLSCSTDCPVILPGYYFFGTDAKVTPQSE